MTTTAMTFWWRADDSDRHLYDYVKLSEDAALKAFYVGFSMHESSDLTELAAGSTLP